MFKVGFRSGFLCLVMTIIWASSFGQATGDYRSVANGNWSTLATWERFNGATWVTPTVLQGYPGQFAVPSVTIQQSNDVVLNVVGATTLAVLTIEAGSLFDPTVVTTTNNPSLTLTSLNQGLTGGGVFTNNNTFTFSGTGSLTISGSAVVGGAGIGITGATFTFSSSGVLTIGGNASITVVSAFNVTAGTFSLGGSLSATANADITFSTTGNVTIGGTTTLTPTTSSLTDSNNTGVSIFTGLVTVDGIWTSTAVTTPGNMIFRGGISCSNTAPGVSAGAGTFNTNNQSLSGTGNIAFGNDVNIPSITLTNTNTGTFSVGGVTTLSTSGGFTDSNNNGLTIFAGNLSVGVGTTYLSTTVTSTAAVVFRGGIAQGGTFTAGGATFNTNNQSITGANSLSFANDVAITAVTVTNSNTANLTITGTTTLATSGGFTDSNNTGITTLVGNVSVGAGTSFITTALTTTANLVFRGGIANSGTAFTAGGATFNTNNQSITGASSLSFANDVAITAVTVTNSNTANLTITGTTTLATSGGGGFTDSNNTGITTLIGNVSVGAGTSFISTAVTTTANLVFRGGIANSGTAFTAGGATFNTNNQSITGASSLSFANDVAITAVTVNNSNTANLTITGTTTLATSGGFTDSNNTGITTLVGNVSVGASTAFTSTAITTTANLVFRGGIANAGSFVAGGATFNTNNQSITGTTGLSFANNVAVTAVTVTNSNTSTFTVSGTTTLATSGGLTDSDNTGATTFVGNVIVGTSTSFISTAVTSTANMIFRGGIANDGTFTAGAATFNTNNQGITGGSNLSFGNNIVIASVTVTNSNTANLTVTGTTVLLTSGGFTDTNNTGITTLVGNLSVGAGTSFLTTVVTTTANLVFRGGIDNSATGTFSAGGATFNTNGQSLTGAGALSFANDVAITGITVTNSNTGAFTITGTTTLTNGGFTDSDNTSVTLFVGNVSQTGTSAFNTTTVTTNPNVTFRGGITNNGGTFTAGAATFNTNNQSLAGNSDISFANFVDVAGVIVTNNNTLSVSLTRIPGAATLTGTGTWTQGASSTLNYTGTSITITNFNSSAAGNTVNYSCNNAAVTIRNSTGSTYHHLTLSGTGSQTKTLSANTVVNGNLTIQNTAIFSVSTFTLSVAGNWSNSSTDADPFVQGAQTVTLNGTAAQTITNTGDAQGSEFNNLIVLNTFGTSPQITLNNATTINGALTLTQGIVATSASALLTLIDNATSNGGDADSYVDGPMRKIGNDAFIFPTGDGIIWARIGISAPATATTEFTAEYFDAYSGSVVTDGTLNDPSDVEYWILSRAVTADGVRVTIFWENNVRSKINDAVSGDLVVARHTGTAWTSHGQFSISSAGATGSVTSNVITTFSPITFGSLSVALNPLPIELVDFRAQAINDAVHLTWETASELNNDFFTVERSLTGETFSSVGQVNGSGTTNQGRIYSLIDLSPVQGTSYYRLKQTDFDGTFTYSKVISVAYEGSLFSVYPNPSAGDYVTIVINGISNMETVPVVIYDQLGRECMRLVLEVDENSNTATKIVNFEKVLPQGMYLIKAGPSQMLVKRFVVTEK